MKRLLFQLILLFGILHLSQNFGWQAFASPNQQTQQSQARYAIFWSNLNTWIVSLDEKTVYQSNHLYGKSHYLLFEYFLTTQSKRRNKANHPYGWIYRWVSLDRHLLQSHFVDQLTHHFLDSEVEGDFFDEHRILQFTNETITLGRWVEQHLENGQMPLNHRIATVYTIDLDNRDTISASDHLPEKLQWLKQTFPWQIPNCLEAQAESVIWSFPGGRQESFDVLASAQSHQESCEQELLLLKKSQKPFETQTVKSLRWDGQNLFDGNQLISDTAIDVLLHPSGEWALILEGQNQFNQNMPLLSAQDLSSKLPRFFAIWHKQSNPQLIRFHQTQLISSLDGIRWLNDDDAFLSLLDERFRSIQQGDCFQAMKVLKLESQSRLPKKWQDLLALLPTNAKQGKTYQHLCEMRGNTQSWSNVDDLSAQFLAIQANESLWIHLKVKDQDLTDQDQLLIWFGQAQNPSFLEIHPKQIQSHFAEPLAQTLSQDQNALNQLNHQWKKIEGGVEITLQMPYAWTEKQIAIAFRDQDAQEAFLDLWLAGAPAEEHHLIGLEEGEQENESNEEVPSTDGTFSYNTQQEEVEYQALSEGLKPIHQYVDPQTKAEIENTSLKEAEVDHQVYSLSALTKAMKSKPRVPQSNNQNPSKISKKIKKPDLKIAIPKLMQIVEDLQVIEKGI